MGTPSTSPTEPRLEKLEFEVAELKTALHLSLRHTLTVFALFATLLIAAGAVGTYNTFRIQREVADMFKETVARETDNVLRRVRIMPYVGRLYAGVQRLKYGTSDDRKVAIWDYLKPVLEDAQKDTRDVFFDVAIEYKEVLPLLEANTVPATFRDSYWGELWILIHLLESRITTVVDYVREKGPAPSAVQTVYRKYAPSLPPQDQKSFAEAVARYEAVWRMPR